MFETTVADGVLQFSGPESRWLRTGPDGGYRTASAAYNVTVPEGWDRTDPAVYARERIRDAGFESPGPALLTGVEQRHARVARAGPIVVAATVGLSNPAAFGTADSETPDSEAVEDGEDTWRPGTVNLLVGTERALSKGTLATLLATAVEAKTATLQARTGFTGTTSDAVAVGTDLAGEAADFAGSATPVGSAARACVRSAVAASMDSRYSDAAVPDSVTEAEHGVVTSRAVEVRDPTG